MPFAAVGAGVGGIGALVGGGKQADATKTAASDQLAAANNATALQGAEFDKVQSNEAPFRDAGAYAVQGLVNNISPLIYNGFDPTDAYGNAAPVGAKFDPTAAGLPAQFSYNAADMQQDPGYQFALDQGNQALQRSAAASGNVFGGATQKAIAQYSQNTANTFYNQDYSRALNTYQQNYSNAANTYQQNYGNAFNTYKSNQSTAMNGLLSLAQIGSGSNAQLASAGQNAANQQSQIALGAGNAQAAGAVGTENAYASMYGGLTNSVNTLLKNSSFQSSLKGMFGSGTSMNGSSYNGTDTNDGFN